MKKLNFIFLSLLLAVANFTNAAVVRNQPASNVSGPANVTTITASGTITAPGVVNTGAYTGTGTVSNTKTFTDTGAVADYMVNNYFTFAPVGASQALGVATYNNCAYTGSGGFTGGGHMVCNLSDTFMNASGQTASLIISNEGRFSNPAGTVTRAVGSLGSLGSNVGTITQWDGVASQVTSNAGGTVTTLNGFNVDASTANIGTIPTLRGLNIEALGGTNAITNFYGTYVPSIPANKVTSFAVGHYISDMAGGVASIGIYDNLTAGANKAFLYSVGGASSIHLGKIAFGTTTFPTATVDVTGSIASTGTINAGGGLIRGITTQTGATYSVVATDTSIICNRAGTITLTLPVASTNTGREFKVRTIQAQTVVSATSNIVPLVGGSAGTAILAASAGKYAVLQSDGTNWQIMEGN